MTSKAAVLRLVAQVRVELSRAHAVRLDKCLAVTAEVGKAVLGDVLREVYPWMGREEALTGFRQFRAAVKEASGEAGVRLSIETDGQTRSAPKDLVVWFEAEDRVTTEVAR